MANVDTSSANAVNVMDIVDSRSLEITAAMDALKTNMSVSARMSIPFHMRRRAASHNPKRIPARVRPPGVEKTKTKVKWKQERRKKEQEGKAVRLETHVWHAKRCHMTDVWGYRIAMTTTQKGDRAAYRAAVNSTTICDASYFVWFSLSADCLHSKMTGVFVPNPFVTDRVLHCHLYHQTVCLGPVSVLWLSDSCVFVRAHPALPHSTDLPSVFEGLSFKSYANKLSQYTLDGVKSMELIVKSLKLSPTTNATVTDVWTGLTNNPFLYDMMGGTVIGCHIEVPPAQFKPFRSVVTDSSITQPTHRLTPSPSLQGGTLFKTLQVTEYAMECQGTAGESSAPSEITPECVPCCAYKDPYTGCVNVVVPRGFGTRFWIPLVYNGGRLIGLEDAHSLNTDRKKLTYPHDYPDSPAGRKHLADTGAEAQAKEMRRPPQKRVPYVELGIKCPFVSDWTALCGSPTTSVIRDSKLLSKIDTLPSSYDNHFVPVSLECVKRGNIKPGAHLFYPLPSNPIPSNPLLPIPANPIPSPNSDPVHCSSSSYPLVGYVTSAKYCLASGGGGAIGLVLCSVLKGGSTAGGSVEGSVVLLVRNTTTKQYRHVKVIIL